MLHQAILKYHKSSFIKEILFVFETEDEMFQKEKELVNEEFCARSDTYNIQCGGKGGHHFTKENAQEFIKKANEKVNWLYKNDLEWAERYKSKLSKAVKRRYEIHGHPWTGKKHSEETKQKMRKSKNAGSQNSQFGTMWITDGINSQRIKKIDNVPNGWYKGRIISKTF